MVTYISNAIKYFKMCVTINAGHNSFQLEDEFCSYSSQSCTCRPTVFVNAKAETARVYRTDTIIPDVLIKVFCNHSVRLFRS